MFVKIGLPYTATLLVMDINNNRVLNDTPVVIIKNTQNNTYFNGMTWQPTMAQIVMPHIANGVYSRQVIFDESGVYKVTTKSDAYSIEKNEMVEVYDTNLMRYSWLLGSYFTIKYECASGTETVQVRISRDLDAMYWDGTSWTTSVTLLTMPLLESNVYTYTFLPDTESDYSITITSGDNELFYILNVTTNGDDVSPVFVDHETFRSTDGTDSTTKDEAGNPMANVSVSVFDSVTKEIVGKTMSNTAGEWNMMIKPGQYYFIFEKEGYMSVSFERTVV
jgi:hypothetical protein